MLRPPLALGTTPQQDSKSRPKNEGFYSLRKKILPAMLKFTQALTSTSGSTLKAVSTSRVPKGQNVVRKQHARTSTRRKASRTVAEAPWVEKAACTARHTYETDRMCISPCNNETAALYSGTDESCTCRRLHPSNVTYISYSMQEPPTHAIFRGWLNLVSAIKMPTI